MAEKKMMTPSQAIQAFLDAGHSKETFRRYVRHGIISSSLPDDYQRGTVHPEDEVMAAIAMVASRRPKYKHDGSSPSPKGGTPSEGGGKAGRPPIGIGDVHFSLTSEVLDALNTLYPKGVQSKEVEAILRTNPAIITNIENMLILKLLTESGQNSLEPIEQQIQSFRDHHDSELIRLAANRQKDAMNRLRQLCGLPTLKNPYLP